MSSNPLVSIITPCFNGEKYLRNFFESILSQTYSNIELFFVDDGSIDETSKIAKEYGIKLAERGIAFFYIYQANRGQAAAINQGLERFSGEYLMWFDSDDIMLPEHIAEKVAFLEDHPELGFVLVQGECVLYDALEERVGIMKRNPPAGEDNLFEDLIFERNVVFNPATIMVRSSVLLTAIPSRKIYESRQGQNWQLMLPVAYNSRCGYLNKVLFKCVEHSDSHSRMYRDYEENIIRQNGFQELLIQTVRNIPQMSESEKSTWYEKILIKHTRKKMECAYKTFRLYDIKHYREELRKNGYKLTMRDSFVFYWLRKILNKAVRRAKRVFGCD